MSLTRHKLDRLLDIVKRESKKEWNRVFVKGGVSQSKYDYYKNAIEARTEQLFLDIDIHRAFLRAAKESIAKDLVAARSNINNYNKLSQKQRARRDPTESLMRKNRREKIQKTLLFVKRQLKQLPRKGYVNKGKAVITL